MATVRERSEIDDEYTWDLSRIYPDDEAWREDLDAVQERLSELTAFEGRSTEDAETLLETLETYEELMRTVGTVNAYARMRKHEDTTDDTYQGMAARAQALASEAGSASSFIETEIQDAGRDRIEAMVEAEPALAEYEHYFDDVLRVAEHTRSTEVESLLAELGEVTGAPGEVYQMLSNADMTFPTVEDPDGEPREVTLSNFTTLQKHENRDFRRRVHEAFYDEWATVHNAVGTTLEKSVTADVKLARAREYDTAREAALDGPNVPVDVYDTLVDTVRDNLDTLHRHADLKNGVTDGADLRPWDVYVPLVEGDSPTVAYDQAREWVVDALAPLGDEYQSRVREGLHDRWVDVYETPNKRSGAYSGGTYDTDPYILMNYQDDVDSLYTLAHELGHSLHSEYTSEHQPYVYSNYEIFVAEVASTVNETLLTHHLLETVEDERLRRHVLNEYLERFRSTLFRQTMFAEFEQEVHALREDGEPLTPDRFDEVYRDLKAAYYAPADLDDRIAREWMRIPHFYSAFYVYQYATGISAAVAIVEDLLQEGQPAADRYLDFLERGSRGYPLELLSGAGVDVASGAPIEAAIGTYDEYLDRFEALQ